MEAGAIKSTVPRGILSTPLATPSRAASQALSERKAHALSCLVPSLTSLARHRWANIRHWMLGAQHRSGTVEDTACTEVAWRKRSRHRCIRHETHLSTWLDRVAHRRDRAKRTQTS